jgi:hypothetical protein
MTRFHRTDFDVRDETGSSLILAFIFLVVMAIMLLTLANVATNDLANAKNFTLAQVNQSDLTNAVETSISLARFDFQPATLNASIPQACTGTVMATSAPYQVTLTHGDGSTSIVDVWCTTLWQPSNTTTRTVYLVACANPSSLAGSAAFTQSAVDAAAAACTNSPSLSATVQFGDTNTDPTSYGTTDCLPIEDPTFQTSCGNSYSITSWNFAAQPPKISSTIVGALTCSGGTSLTINGVNLDHATTVYFFNNSLASRNVVDSVSLTPLTTNVSATQISLCSPDAVGSSSFRVATPAGLSAAISF